MTLTIEDTWVAVAGKKLRVRQINHPDGLGKPTMVFLHEGLGCIALWKDFPQLLVEKTGLNALIYERQGYGQSSHLDLPRPLNYLEIEAQKYLPALLEHFSIQEPILVGHSDGGTIALIYAALYPVSMLLVVAAHVLVEEVTLEGIQTAVEAYHKETVGKKLEKYHGAKADDLFWAWANTWLHPEFRAWNIKDYLPQINCPTLVVQGREDEYATTAHLDYIAEGIGSCAKKKLIDACAHVPHVQAKIPLLKEMKLFVEKNLKKK